MWHEGGLSWRFGQGDAINAWQMDLDWFGNWQDKGTSLNSILVTGEFAPEFSLKDLASGLTVRPYGTLTYSILQKKPLYTAYGGGLAFGWELSDQLLLEFKYDLRNSAYDGKQFSATNQLTYLVNETLQLSVSALYSWADLSDDEYSYDGFAVQAGLIWDSGLQIFDAGSTV